MGDYPGPSRGRQSSRCGAEQGEAGESESEETRGQSRGWSEAATRQGSPEPPEAGGRGRSLLQTLQKKPTLWTLDLGSLASGAVNINSAVLNHPV